MREVKTVEAVWRERAERLSAREVSAGPAQNAVPVLVLGIAKERYGIDLPDVAEVLPLTRPTPVPGAAAVFAGVINVHGEIRPVIDLRCCLGLEHREKAASGDLARVILLHRKGRELGLQIDSVEQIRWIGAGEMGSGEMGSGEMGSGEMGSGEMGAGDLAATGKCEAGGSPHVKGSTKDLLMLLSTEALFAHLDTGVTN